MNQPKFELKDEVFYPTITTEIEGDKIFFHHHIHKGNVIAISAVLSGNYAITDDALYDVVFSQENIEPRIQRNINSFELFKTQEDAVLYNIKQIEEHRVNIL